MRIGFDVSGGEDHEESEVGAAIPADNESPWYDGFGEYMFELWIKFAIVYGSYAAIRDLVRSLF